ncbi:periplasmic divalent cation tolerance protein [Lipingzhangella halophila]|uniref:Periplasmic divalent cation tolerance protein n=1 Tax=Lipingzhangella halophila TaxID=1783352 RepID=A0A7W7RN53_9ACTN|nr:divalent-cation tolerance protein CutA [Lipingzhangella halophila]MBB4935073.1 periplasmic divalent cation tolerance protein [Lipingzhangella halophila]
MSDSGSAERARVETTTDSRASAGAIARSAVEHRVAACAQVMGPITSFFRWEGEVQDQEEWLVVLKTATDRLSDLTAHLLEVHPYDVPEIISVPIEGGNPEYLAWLADETRAET